MAAVPKKITPQYYILRVYSNSCSICIWNAFAHVSLLCRIYHMIPLCMYISDQHHLGLYLLPPWFTKLDLHIIQLYGLLYYIPGVYRSNSYQVLDGRPWTVIYYVIPQSGVYHTPLYPCTYRRASKLQPFLISEMQAGSNFVSFMHFFDAETSRRHQRLRHPQDKGKKQQ